MINKKLNGLYIDRYKLSSPENKDQVSFSDWKYGSFTAKEWITDFIDQGQVVTISDVKKGSGKYNHKEESWVSSTLIAIDGDNVSFTEDNGKVIEGTEPFNGTVKEWKAENPEILKEIYGLGESLSTLARGTPLHRRFRIWVYLEEAIDNREDYDNFLKGFASIYPIAISKKRQPLQPVFGSAAPYKVLRDGEVEEKYSKSSTEIYDNIISKERVAELIEIGKETTVKEKQQNEQERKERREKIMEVQKNNGGMVLEPTKKVKADNSDNRNRVEPDDQVKELSMSLETAKSFLEDCGSVYAGEMNGGHRFHREGKDDGHGEVLFVREDGKIIFHAHSDNSYFVTNGYCKEGEGITFATLFRRVLYPTKSRLQLCEIIAKKYPHLDNQWRSDLKFENLNPISALNYNMELIQKYIIDQESEEALEQRKLRVISPGFDDRIAVFWNEKWTCFSEYWAFVEDVEKELALIANYDGSKKSHKRAWAVLNEKAAELTGDTGKWKSRKRSRSLDMEEV